MKTVYIIGGPFCNPHVVKSVQKYFECQEKYSLLYQNFLLMFFLREGTIWFLLKLLFSNFLEIAHTRPFLPVARNTTNLFVPFSTLKIGER